MAAEAESEAADLGGPHSGMTPATPDIVRKPARPSQTTGTDASCCTALFTSAAPEPGKVESDDVGSVPSTAGEQSQSALEDLGEVDCAVSTQESSNLPAKVDESSGKVEQQQKQQEEEGAANGSDADAVPTPEKVESTPRRWRKKSTKGVPRFKVVKDKVMKAKGTPKTATPGKVKKEKKMQEDKKKRKVQEDGSGHFGAGSSNSVRRKLDFDSPETKPSYSRATLMTNLRSLAKIYGLPTDLPQRTRSKRGRKRKSTAVQQWGSCQLAILPYQGTPTDTPSSSLVPLGRRKNHDKKLNAKVLGLTEETLRVCDVLVKWELSDTESFEGFDIGSGPEWDGIRRVFEQCADVFIAALTDLMGPRKFSPWGGSLMDSVIGTFLTQNVADHLSSNAFMNLAAEFPPRKKHDDSADSVSYKHVGPEKEATEAKGHYGQEYNRIIENFIAVVKQEDISTWELGDLMNLVKDKSGKPVCTERTVIKFMAALQPKVTSSDWKELREEAYRRGYNNENQNGTGDAVDWESVLNAPLPKVANCIAVRGQHYIMGVRIQVFLMRVMNAQDGSFDLDWLRYVSHEKAKQFLLSIYGIGEKSADCIRLLSLRHKAFPVDVNVARIVTRLGWVELQPLDGVEFHLVNSYPIMRDVQKYLWPRLCTIDKEKLYELHCHMITFGKVICTKINPNCNACPFNAKCKYYSSSLNRKSLPPPVKDEHREEQAHMLTFERFLSSNGSVMSCSQQMYQHQIEISMTAERSPIQNCEPIVEMPPSPEYEYGYKEEHNGQEDFYEDYPCDLEDIVPDRVPYDAELDIRPIKRVANNCSWTPNCGKDLAVINPGCSFGRNQKLKNIGRLRTEHYAYVLPDDHVILEEFEERVLEDQCPYLLVVISCPDDFIVKGTILIPSRTANRGNFPLDGTYFQPNEVFADHSSSRYPMTIPRECIGMLERRIVYFGPSIHSIAKGQTRQDIQECFLKGYVCFRGFDRRTRAPMRLCGTLHATSTEKKEAQKKEGGQSGAKRARTSPKQGGQEKQDDDLGELCRKLGTTLIIA